MHDLCRREAELVEHAIRQNNADVSARLRDRTADLAGMPEIRQRLVTALRMRLEMIHPHIDTWPQV